MPHGRSSDHENNLWATDVAAHQVFKFANPDATDGTAGKLLLRLGERMVPGDKQALPTLRFNKPTDVAVDATNGDVYVSDGYGNSRVVVLSKAGHYLREWGEPGTGDGQFDTPHSIEIEQRTGLVFVADRNNGRIQVFQKETGAFLRVLASPHVRAGALRNPDPWLGYVSAVSFDPNLQALFSIEGAHVVMRDPFTGVIMQAWGGKTGHGDGEVDFPHDIEVIYGDNGAGGAAKSRVFVTELDNPRVQQWTASLDVAWGDARYLDSGGR